MMSYTDENATARVTHPEPERHPASSGPAAGEARSGETPGRRRSGRDGWSLDLDDGDIEADLFFGRD